MQSLVKNLGIRSKFQFESETAVFPLLTAGLVGLPAIPSWILSLPQLWLYPLRKNIKWNWCSVCLTENILQSNSSIIHILFRSHHHWSFLEKSFCFSTRFLLFKMFSWSGNCGIFESLLDREHSWPLENVHWIDIWNLEHRTHFIELPNFQKMS